VNGYELQSTRAKYSKLHWARAISLALDEIQTTIAFNLAKPNGFEGTELVPFSSKLANFSLFATQNQERFVWDRQWCGT
jgi:hypothetical protein